MPITDDQVKQFMALYVSNQRSFGSWMPDTGKMYTVKRAYEAIHARAHLEGEIGIGMVAITDDSKCAWAAIDIDTHGKNAKPIDIAELDAKILKYNLPLIPCRSKSGGVHCYLFLTEPTAASKVRLLLSRWSARLGVTGAEIFPKQETLDPENTPGVLGNWINLPYCKAEDTVRYAQVDGRRLSLDEFLARAKAKRYKVEDKDLLDDDLYSRGPPCIQKMIKGAIPEGSRNTGVFQAGIFLKRAAPETWRGLLNEFNQTATDAPLSSHEMKTIVGSVSRKDYNYKCRESPCKDFCDRDTCRLREFGITLDDSKATEVPLFDKVEKIIATPIRWVIHVKGSSIELTTPELFDYQKVRIAVGERLHLVLPLMKRDEWDLYLRDMMRKIEIKEEITYEDTLFEKLCRFLSKARDDKSLDEDERRSDLNRHRPALISTSQVKFGPGGSIGEKEIKDWYYAFRGPDFIEHLKRQKSLTLPEHTVYSYLVKILGEDSKRDRVKHKHGEARNVWFVPESAVVMEAVPAREFKTEY